jgi:hypothetical protein
MCESRVFRPAGRRDHARERQLGSVARPGERMADHAIGGEDDLVVVLREAARATVLPLISMLAAAAADAPLECEPAGRIE